MNVSLHLTDLENNVLEELCAAQELSKTQLLKQALRMYQHIVLKRQDSLEMAFIDKNGTVWRQVIVGLGEIE